MLSELINESRNDPFTQKWLTGSRLKFNLIIAFAVLGIAMHMSLKLLSNYENWPVESVVIQWLALIAPLVAVLSYTKVKQIKIPSLRKFALRLLLLIAGIDIFLLAGTMGVVARNQPVDPFGVVLSIYGFLSIVYLARLTWLSGKRTKSD